MRFIKCILMLFILTTSTLVVNAATREEAIAARDKAEEAALTCYSWDNFYSEEALSCDLLISAYQMLDNSDLNLPDVWTEQLNDIESTIWNTELSGAANLEFLADNNYNNGELLIEDGDNEQDPNKKSIYYGSACKDGFCFPLATSRYNIATTIFQNAYNDAFSLYDDIFATYNALVKQNEDDGGGDSEFKIIKG